MIPIRRTETETNEFQYYVAEVLSVTPSTSVLAVLRFVHITNQKETKKKLVGKEKRFLWRWPVGNSRKNSIAKMIN